MVMLCFMLELERGMPNVFELAGVSSEIEELNVEYAI